MRKKKMKAITGAGEKDDTCDHGLYVQKLKSRSVPKKIKKSLPLSVVEEINQQSARSTSSTKQHKLICQLRTNTAACTWPANDYSNGIRDHSNNKARHPPKSLLGQRNTKRVRCDTGRMHATHWFLPWMLSSFTTTFAWRSLTRGGTIIFPLIFCVENVWYTLTPCHKTCHKQKAYCV